MKKVFLIILLIISLICFYLINEINYKKIREIKLNTVEHPENLPTKEMAVNTSIWFRNLKADFYWLEAIQYIWSNAISSKYKKYLYSMLDTITELNPFFEHPYVIWELLLPEYNQRYEKLSKETQEINIKQWVDIGLKWIKNFCDDKKVEAIKNDEDAYDFYKLRNDERYKNPCKSYKIAYNLAYIYFQYLKDPETASFYYRLSYANENSLEWAKMMASIMKWKWWDREKSFFMFLNMASQTDDNEEDNDKICSDFSKYLIKYTTDKRFVLDWNVIKQIEETRKKIFPPRKNDKWEILDAIWCEHYLNKAVRELNLIYIEIANNEFEKKYNKPAKDATELLEKKFISLIPEDPQSREDNTIEYFYNEDLKHFDYR